MVLDNMRRWVNIAFKFECVKKDGDNRRRDSKNIESFDIKLLIGSEVFKEKVDSEKVTKEMFGKQKVGLGYFS